MIARLFLWLFLVSGWLGFAAATALVAACFMVCKP